MSKFYNYNVVNFELDERAAFCGGKAALVLCFDKRMDMWKGAVLRIRCKSFQRRLEGTIPIKREEPVIFFKDYRQIMKKILSKCKQQQLHLTFISITLKYEEIFASM